MARHSRRPRLPKVSAESRREPASIAQGSSPGSSKVRRLVRARPGRSEWLGSEAAERRRMC